MPFRRAKACVDLTQSLLALGDRAQHERALAETAKPRFNGSLGPSVIATYDESRWPVVVCTVKAGLRPQGSFSAHLGELESYIARGPCVLVIDQSRADPLQPRERKLVASLIRRANTTYRGRLLGVAIVFESKLKVGIVTAVHWLAQPGYPFKAAMSVDSALAWASAVASGVSAEPK